MVTVPQRIPFILGPAALPGAPALTSVAPYDAGALVTWTAPVGSATPIVGYTVTVSETATGALAAAVSVAPDVFSAGVAPLRNDVQYSVVVYALSGIGSSGPSGELQVTPSSSLPPLEAPTQPPPVRVALAQPLVQAFPVDRPFHPDFWLLSAQEADAL